MQARPFLERNVPEGIPGERERAGAHRSGEVVGLSGRFVEGDERHHGIRHPLLVDHIRIVQRILLVGSSAYGKAAPREGEGRRRSYASAPTSVTWSSSPRSIVRMRACYDYTPVEDDQGYAMVTEERTAFPLVMAFDDASGQAVMVLRLTPARESSPLSII